MKAINKLAESLFADDSEQLTKEELFLEAEEHGVNVSRLISKTNELVNAALTRMKNERLSLQNESKNKEEASVWKLLSSLSSLSFANAETVLSGEKSVNAISEADIMREINIADYFSHKELSEQLSWLGPQLQIGRAIDDDEANVVYSVYAEACSPDSEQTKILIIELKTDDDKCARAVLSADSPSAVFVGDPLPADWNEVLFKLSIQ